MGDRARVNKVKNIGGALHVLISKKMQSLANKCLYSFSLGSIRQPRNRMAFH